MLFLYDESKNISFENHFVKFNDESNEYSENPEFYLINFFDELQLCGETD